MLPLLATFDVLADALSWGGDKLLVPILTGVAVGLALRTAAIPREANDHQARAEELNADLSRWVHDRSRELDSDIHVAAGLAKQGIIEDVVMAPVPKELEHLPPGSQLDSGAFLMRVERIMQQALHEYRDEMSGKVRSYRSMARAETFAHRSFRRLRGRRDPATLVMPPSARLELQRFRERTAPDFSKSKVTVDARDDRSQGDDATDIAPLEAGGLSWNEAARAPD